MLTDYLSCYKFKNKSTLLPREEKFLKVVKFSLLLKFWGIQTLVFINLKKKKK